MGIVIIIIISYVLFVLLELDISIVLVFTIWSGFSSLLRTTRIK